MGVLNVTPDSFSDGGRLSDVGAAVAFAEQLVADGADIVDVGAESTRPGATPVPEAEEWTRLEPVLKRLGKLAGKARLSVDTRKPALMTRAADLGVTFVNDVAGGAPAPVLATLAGYPGLQYIAMHMWQSPETMQKSPLCGAEAVRAVDAFFEEATDRLLNAGFDAERVWLDPGVGFGKDDAGNLQLIAATKRWAELHQLCVGVSRKGFIGRALGIAAPRDRDPPTKMLEVGLAALGAKMIRTHDVARLRTLVDLMSAPDEGS